MSSVKKIAFCAVFVVVIIVGTFIRIPTPLIPITFQVFAVTLASIFLGGKLGAFSAAGYMALGLLGLPIFTSGGGLGAVLSPTFGYIVGFIIEALLTGYLINKVKNPSFLRIILSSFAGLAVMYFFGVTYFYFIGNVFLTTKVGLWTVLLTGFLMCLPGDILMTIIAALIAVKLLPLFRRNFLNLENRYEVSVSAITDNVVSGNAITKEQALMLMKAPLKILKQYAGSLKNSIGVLNNDVLGNENLKNVEVRLVVNRTCEDILDEAIALKDKNNLVEIELEIDKNEIHLRKIKKRTLQKLAYVLMFVCPRTNIKFSQNRGES